MKMSTENQNGAGGTNSDAGSNTENQTENQTQSVDYGTFQKVLDQRKSDQKRLKELQNQLDAMTQDKLKAEGNKDQLIADLQKQLNNQKTSTQQIVFNAVKGQVASRAKALGCVDPEGLVQLAGPKLGELSEGLTDSLELDFQAVDALLEDMRKSKSYLFTGSAKQTKDVTPSNHQPGSIKTSAKKELDDLWDDLRKLS